MFLYQFTMGVLKSVLVELNSTAEKEVSFVQVRSRLPKEISHFKSSII